MSSFSPQEEKYLFFSDLHTRRCLTLRFWEVVWGFGADAKPARAARAKPELTSCPNQATPGCPDR